MTTITVAPPHDGLVADARRGGAFADTLTMARRNLRRVSRTPQLIAFSSVLPISFTLMFRYVFGGSVHIRGISYVDYLIPTMLVLSTLFGATTAVAMAVDMNGGMIDRFRSLPIARSAVLAGRTAADLARNTLVAFLVLAVGALLGFRAHNGFVPAVAAVGLVLLFSYALSWGMAWIGMRTRDPETAQVAAFLPLFIMVFAGPGLVPVHDMPGWLQAFAHVQPVSVTISTVRALTEGGPVYHTLWQSLAWTAALLAAFVALAVAEYRKV
jgi:ABC-2 type transport system permease protein/oleandomycin transport system permease protein